MPAILICVSRTSLTSHMTHTFKQQEFWFGKGEREAGNLGYDPLGFFKKKTDAQKDYLRLNELKNGRLAMIAMAAYTSEHWIPGSVPFLPGKF